jgi:RimJ/RimL family protein N-acetyltransferase
MSSITSTTFTTKSGQSVTFRTAQPEDAARLIAYGHAVFPESPHFLIEPDEFNLTEEQERQWIQDHLDGPGTLVILAEVPDEVIGCLSFENGLRRRVSHRGNFGVSVRQAWRGQGIGTAMLKALIGWAEAKPLIEKIALSVFATNVDAIRLYQRLGFVAEGRQPREFKIGPGEYADNVLMSRFV